MRHLRMDRRDRAFALHPRHTAEIASKDSLRRAGGQGLCRQRWVWTADAIGEGRVIGDEQPLDPARLGVLVEKREYLVRLESDCLNYRFPIVCLLA